MVVAFPVNVQVPEPIFNVRVPVPVRLNVCIVGLFAPTVNVPVKAPMVMDVTVGL